LIEYLYPNNENVTETTPPPKVTFPIRLAIVLVPDVPASAQTTKPSDNIITVPTGDVRQNVITLSDMQKKDLMEKIAIEFKKYSFVGSCDLIASTYLTPKGGI
jgi:rhombotail lipoprotein